MDKDEITQLIFGVITIFILIFTFIGEIKCIKKATDCNWDPVGKAEIVYTSSAICGAGGIVGWINIKDE